MEQTRVARPPTGFRRSGIVRRHRGSRSGSPSAVEGVKLGNRTVHYRFGGDAECQAVEIVMSLYQRITLGFVVIIGMLSTAAHLV